MDTTGNIEYTEEVYSEDEGVYEESSWQGEEEQSEVENTETTEKKDEPFITDEMSKAYKDSIKEQIENISELIDYMIGNKKFLKIELMKDGITLTYKKEAKRDNSDNGSEVKELIENTYTESTIKIHQNKIELGTSYRTEYLYDNTLLSKYKETLFGIYTEKQKEKSSIKINEIYEATGLSRKKKIDSVLK